MSSPARPIDVAWPQELQSSRAFDALAPSYDSLPNPLLALEQRYLERLLPSLHDRDVLDVGCGSGRWLTELARRRPRGLTGLDLSREMLEVARQKKLPGVELLHRSCTGTGMPDGSVDLLLSSFVLSHVGDLPRAVSELTRIARPGCGLFISDIHPEAQRKLGWKRAFHDATGVIEFETHRRSPRQVAALFAGLGWDVTVSIIAEFGPPERAIFEAAARLSRFHEAAGHPAIYLLHLRKRDAARPENSGNRMSLAGARCALGPEESTAASLRICNGAIDRIVANGYAETCASSGLEIDLTGYLLMPGMVNAHDHLEFALFPRLGNPPYANAAAWARDIQKNLASVIARHKAVAKEVRLWWGGIRNLLCGVTTVCHHNPPEPELQRADFPVHAIQNCGWAHSIAFGGDLRSAKAAALAGRPFIVHACEGIDDCARAELGQLDSLGLLDGDLVLIHGLAIDDDGAALLRDRGTSVVLCPSSNDYLFGVVPEVARLERIRDLALGSDSPLTAAGDLLDEIRFAIHNCGIAPPRAYRMATEAPASILRLTGGEGSMRAGAQADLIAVRDTGCTAARTLSTLSAAEIELVLVSGQVRLASSEMMNRLPAALSSGLEPLWCNGSLRWLRAPITQLDEVERVLGAGAVQLGGKPIRRPTAEEIAHAS